MNKRQKKKVNRIHEHKYRARDPKTGKWRTVYSPICHMVRIGELNRNGMLYHQPY